MSYICKYCGKEFNSHQSLGAHIIICDKNPNSHKFDFINRRKTKLELENPLEEHKLYCKVCNSLYTVVLRRNQFLTGNYKVTCSRRCASILTARNTNKSEKNSKIANTLSLKSQKTKICCYCGKEYNSHDRGKSKFCSDDCRKKFNSEKLSISAKKRELGGYNPNSIKKHHHGTYKGIRCDSSWELAYLVYCIEHDINIKRCNETRFYTIDGIKHKYFPDFVVNDKIIEIKGYLGKEAKEKSIQNPDIIVITRDEMKKFLEYTKNKYGINFWNVLYDKI